MDPLTSTATQLRELLRDDKLSSVDILEKYLEHIGRHDDTFNAFTILAPRDKLHEAARALDAERSAGKLRSRLHGIPIVLKDCFVTAASSDMPTTAGSWAFADAEAKDASPIVQRLIDAGLIILGKTNMTEFAGMKMMTSPGRSSFGGQTRSPYVQDVEQDQTILGHSSPGGSSTGSAVAVAAGFSPLALGSETIGSIITPASRAALYALKPTHGLQDVSRNFRMTDFFDCAGPMAKSVDDVVALSEILLGRTIDCKTPIGWDNLTVGFLSPEIWKLSPAMCRQYEGTAEQMVEAYEATVARIRSVGCATKYPVDVPDVSLLTVDGEDAIMPIAYWEFKNVGIPGFIQAFDTCSVSNLGDIIRFNEENAELALPPPFDDQSDLVKAWNSDESPSHIAHLRTKLGEKARTILDEVFDREGIDILIAPADSSFPIYSFVAGYPVATVPLGQLSYNGRPFGLCLVGRAHFEETLLRFMSAYGSCSPQRAVPKL